jgi:hypothetical protein
VPFGYLGEDALTYPGDNGQQSAMPPQTPQGQKRKAWPVRHKVLTGLIAFGALVVIGGVASASNKPSTTVSDTRAAGSSASASASSAAASSAPTKSAGLAASSAPSKPAGPAARSAPSKAAAPVVSSAPSKAAAPAASSPPSTAAAPASPSLTTAQQQAVEAAQGYVGMGSGFSYESLLNQLTSSAGNGFATSDAEFAIKYLNPNWDQQAVDSAQGYLGMGSGFSDQGLLKQLTSSAGSGFTEAQAEYAINHLQPNWDAQAVDAAKGYMQIGGFSRATLIQQLTSSYGSGFTEAQAEYAASQVGL